MRKNRERDWEIYCQRQEGFATADLAAEYGLTRQRIQMIEREVEAEKALLERRARVREQIRQADDLQRSWPVEDLLAALIVSARTRRVLGQHYTNHGQQAISLEGVFELVFLETGKSKSINLQNSALLAMPGLSNKSFWWVVSSLTKMDLGQHCNVAWKKKLAEVLQHCGKPGPPRGLSFEP